MAEGSVNVSVGASADEVWATVGDFGGIDAFFPGIESFRIEGDDRVIGMFGMEIRERLLSHDDAARTLTYSVVEGVPIDSHTATIAGRARRQRLQGHVELRRRPRRDGAHLRRHLPGGAQRAGVQFSVGPCVRLSTIFASNPSIRSADP